MKVSRFYFRNRPIGKQKPEQICTAEEGYYTPGAPEVWRVRRVLNGDETDRGSRFPNAPAQPANASGDRAHLRQPAGPWRCASCSGTSKL
jgi:hypothetical protein